MRSFVAWGLMPAVLACSFDATGVDSSPPAGSATTGSGAGSSTGVGSGADTTGEPTTSGGGGSGGATTGEPELTTEPVTTGPGTTESVTTGPMETTTGMTGMTGTSTTDDSTTTTDPMETTTGTSTTDDSTTTGPPETTGPPPCEQMFVKEVLLVDDAMVAGGMVKVMSNMGEGIVAYSEMADKGTVTFTVDLECPGPVAVWGRVQDTIPGVANPDPDSYYVRTDGDPETGWYYGCQTMGKMPGYHWLRVTSATQLECGAPSWSPDLGAGTHTFRLRNREAVIPNTAVAAVARLLITNDMNYVPQMNE